MKENSPLEKRKSCNNYNQVQILNIENLSHSV